VNQYKSILNYFIGILSGTFVNSIIFILLAKKFDDSTFGILNLFYTLFLFLTLVYVWGFGSLLIVDKQNRQHDSLVCFARELSIINSAKNIVLSLLFLLSFGLIHYLFFKNVPSETIFYPYILVVIGSFVFSFASLNNTFFRKENRSRDYLRAALIGNVIYILFVLAFWSVLDLKYFFIALILKYLVIVFYFPKLHKLPAALPGFRTGFSTIKKATPFFISAVSITLIDFSDNYFLAVFSTLENVGYYGLIYKFGFFFSTFIAAFFFLFDPLSLKIRNESIIKNLPKAILGFTALGLIYFFIVRFVLGLAFVEAYFGNKLNLLYNFKYIVLIYVLYAINSYMMAVFYKDNHKFFAWINGLAVISNIVLNIYLIPRYEVEGAILATIATYSIQLLIIIYVIKKKLGLAIIKPVGNMSAEKNYSQKSGN